MEKKVTALDVARAAGVSQSTVSRVFSPQSNITSRKREHILKVARELGYHPNALARGLTMNRSYIVAMIGVGREDVFYSSLLAGLIDGLQKNGLQMLIFNYHKPNQLEEIIEKLYQYNVDGILITSSVIDQSDIDKMERIGKPIVLINRMISGRSVRAVCCDNADGTEKILNHFKDIGRVRIGVLRGPDSSYTANDRTIAFMENLEAYGMKLQSMEKADELTHLSGKLAMKKLMASGNQLDAIFCTNDLLAIGAIDAIHEQGISAPEQIAIAGFDGDVSGMWSPYRLTTIKQPIDQLVEGAIFTLNELLQGKDVPPCQWFRGELVIRNSTVREQTV